MRKATAPRAMSAPRHRTRERAKHLLVHRANGGIHNAVIALKLVTERLPSAGSPSDTPTFVAAGVRGAASAARALQLLGALVGLESVSSPYDADAFVDDIGKILATESRRHGITLKMDLIDHAPGDSTIPVAVLAEIFVEGLAAVENTVPNSFLAIRARQRASPSGMPLTMEIDVSPSEAK